MSSPVTLARSEMGRGLPVVILHGLFGRRRNWQAFQKRLAEDARIVAADLRNHGESPWHADMTYPAMAGDVAQLIRDLDAGPAVVIGHSMGGKAAMTLAMTMPDLVKGAMIIDIAPVAYDHDYSPYIDAMRAIPIDKLSRRSEAEVYLADAVDDPGIRSFLMQNIGQGDDDLTWQVNLDAIERNMDAILDFPSLDGDPYEGPTLFLAGGLSDYVGAEHRPAVESLFPMAEMDVVDGAGHWVHADKPAEVVRHIGDFIKEVG